MYHVHIFIISFWHCVYIDTIDVHHTCDEDVTTVIKTLIRSITMSSLVINTSGGHHLTSTAFIDSGKQFYIFVRISITIYYVIH